MSLGGRCRVAFDPSPGISPGARSLTDASISQGAEIYVSDLASGWDPGDGPGDTPPEPATIRLLLSYFPHQVKQQPWRGLLPDTFEFELPLQDDAERKIFVRHAALLPHEAFHTIFTKVRHRWPEDASPRVG